MKTISLEKMQLLYKQVVILLTDSDVEEHYYVQLIQQLETIEAVVKANESHFGADTNKIIAICFDLICSVRAKLSQVMESITEKPIYQ